MKINKQNFKSLQSTSHIPGQSWTNPRRTLPYDRHAEYGTAEEYIKVILRQMTTEKMAMEFLSLMDQGIPLEQIVAGIAQSAFGEGKVPAAAAYLLVPPLTVLLYRMAESAGIDVPLMANRKVNNAPKAMIDSTVSSNRVAKAIRAGKQSNEDVSNMPKKMGLMKRPEGMM